MRWNAFWRVLGLSLLVVGTWQDDTENPDNEAQKHYYKVSISGTRIELTCPLESDFIHWEKNDKVLPEENEKTLVLQDFSEVGDSGYYACYLESSEKNAYLYLKARVCENCVEVDLTAVAIIIIVDICITLGLLMVVYYWSKSRKAKAKPVSRGTGAGGRPRGQNKERPPPVPNPDYEPIRKGQRDLYSGLNQRAV
ncbi:T-cell surface glycoprotein CD3 epsilon chain [Mesocricetus auratus]|uniref:T-cell surface glycoprotein CD3 epsilon chain n=1 Tax=Mesocricetus auratus TaxID=10036 RepID=A0A3Q0CNZ4_MESAU|nr:T-cell surface glycoprotein CD3 epsilon chain [Mesocricetus auratus]XP_021082411.1 T-cell surface glycoprotein CD3 epsilon chain [Mesocricetus auratus]XP_021082413.1 T-cell surface glycoprotein CD3 epsilon chain [Mesocricetus auratus]